MSKLTDYIRATQRMQPRPIAKDEVELINPTVGGKAFELLRAYHVREWRDASGWHVIVPAGRVAEIEQAERERRNQDAKETN